MFLCKAGVIPQNFFLAPSFGEQIQYEFNRQSRSSNDGLAGQNGRVSNDVVMPVHETKLPLLVKFRPALRSAGVRAPVTKKEKNNEEESQ